jgi:hypothetical protein
MPVLYLHGSPVVAGLAVFASTAPSFLVYIPAGALVDRWEDPRRTMTLAETGRGIAIGLIVRMLFLHWGDGHPRHRRGDHRGRLEVFAVLAERRYVRVLGSTSPSTRLTGRHLARRRPGRQRPAPPVRQRPQQLRESSPR